jgi:hypothetical protein
MNDPETLAVYTQLVVFRGDGSMSELIIRDPDHPKQNILCNFAHSLDLEYEYDLNLKKARISRGPQIDHDSNLTDSSPPKFVFPSPVINQPSYYINTSVHDSLEREVDSGEVTLRPISLVQPMDTASNRESDTTWMDEWLNYDRRPVLSSDVRNDAASIKSFSSKGSTSGSASSSIHSSRSIRSFSSSRSVFSSSFKSGSGASSSSGRRGPLSNAARAAAKAVKFVRACWRCRILRKKVRYQFKWNQRDEELTYIRKVRSR